MSTTIKFFAKRVVLCLLTTLLCCIINAQEKIPSPTPPPIVDDVGCGLIADELVKISVSVLNPKDKTYINNLNYKDFEVREGSELREIEYFMKPDLSESLKNEYVIGFTPTDLMRKKWRDLRVRVKTSRGNTNLIVKLTPNGYYY